MGESLLLVVALGMVFTIFLQLVSLIQNYQIRQIIQEFKEVYSMTTAEVLAALQASNDFTSEIATDIDKLIELVGTADGVPTEVSDAVLALKDRLAGAAAKFNADA